MLRLFVVKSFRKLSFLKMLHSRTNEDCWNLRLLSGVCDGDSPVADNYCHARSALHGQAPMVGNRQT